MTLEIMLIMAIVVLWFYGYTIARDIFCEDRESWGYVGAVIWPIVFIIASVWILYEWTIEALSGVKNKV